MKLSSSKNSQILLLVLLVVALLFAVYYYVVLPKQTEVDSLNRSISSLSTEVKTLQASVKQTESAKNSKTTNQYELSKLVPQSREVDKLLLNIEEIEYVTNSIVTNISFSEFDTAAADADIQITSADENTEGQSETDQTQNSESTEGATAEESPSPITSLTGTLPAELKLITFKLEVTSPDYMSLLQFIQELESLDRIMHVDAINYSLLGEEAEFEEDVTDTVNASIQVTTFYYDGE
ncbi:MAG TPA: potassium transporter [Ureibacillus sp.]|nr:potassium transporter [Ureibacillus sp.]